MKTYSRKKSGESQEVIIDLNDLCRLCMGKEDELISIFNNEEPIPLTLRIMACVALEVFEGDGLPDKICHPCKFQLEKSYNFRKKCESSDTKLRQHLKELKDKMGDIEEENERQDDETEMDVSEEGEHIITQEDSQPGPSTEEDLVGVTKVSYIEPDPEPENDPENITLPPETDDTIKEACTLKSDDQLKTEIDTENEDGENVFIIEESDHQMMDDTNMDAIADAVKATLASQPVNQSDGKSTQVEVITEDGSVIVMELMTEEEAELPGLIPESRADVNEEGELKIFQCPDCPKSFARRIQLRRHASVHMQQRGFSCGICEKWFPTRSALVRHERIHTGERPFQCEVCQKSFAQKEILFRHLMTHTGQKPYSCPHCPKGFTQKEPLRVHLRTHIATSPSDIQLHYCSLCPKVFCHASGLSRHLVTHTGKTFKCRDCDKSFTDKSSLRRHHLQTNHQP
ncbi:hypothetical protein NQ314_011424 [Rhamnusium bicolor]|uniref:Uncharacterized protein n=1 Tax=Rhamnusium bicolor TaxID=1586634 RepID=A0AAV8XIL2_9CUCU|nr:hypothetical protein NQ314_011424 [Rhamnusium bicolor]